jgi:Uma2 family endonuclease
MATYAETFHEWIDGVVVKMSPVTLRHAQIVDYLRHLLQTYCSLRPVAQVLSEPFVMRLDLGDRISRREPDLQVILNANRARVQATYTDGPADICIEVVSPGSVAIDYGEKLVEYEAGGVQEYWIIDPERQLCHFYRRQGDYYQPIPRTDAHTTPLLPAFRLDIATLWADDLPDILDVVEIVKVMLAEDETR